MLVNRWQTVEFFPHFKVFRISQSILTAAKVCRFYETEQNCFQLGQTLFETSPTSIYSCQLQSRAKRGPQRTGKVEVAAKNVKLEHEQVSLFIAQVAWVEWKVSPWAWAIFFEPFSPFPHPVPLPTVLQNSPGSLSQPSILLCWLANKQS